MRPLRVRISDSEKPIVLVDDDADDRRTAIRCYKRSRLTNPVLAFSMGEELLAYLEQVKRGECAMPAVVLLDIRMPQMNGFEVLERVRANAEFKECPVIVMLTNSDYERDIERAMNLGANAYQEKPTDLSVYVEFFDSLASDSAVEGTG